jgi:hypothetical protein
MALLRCSAATQYHAHYACGCLCFKPQAGQAVCFIMCTACCSIMHLGQTVWHFVLCRMYAWGSSPTATWYGADVLLGYCPRCGLPG